MTTTQPRLVLRHLRDWAAAQDVRGLPDRLLVERFLARRDEAAFAALVKRHGPLVLGVCRRVLGNWHDAEDAFQATFFILARKAGTIGRHVAVGSWLYQVAYHVALRARQRVVARHRREERAASPEQTDPLAEVTGRELMAVLDEELHRLPEGQRAPLVLCYLQGQTRDEAARALGWSLGTLKRRLEQGRQRLRGRLARRGVTVPAALLTAGLAPGASVSAALSAGAVATARGPGGGAVAHAVTTLADETWRALGAGKAKLGAALVLAVGLAVLGVGALVQPRWTTSPAGELAAASPPAGQAKERLRPVPPADAAAEPKPMTVTGRVLAPDGRPLAGANVAVWGRQGLVLSSNEWWASFRNEVLGQVKADKDGNYQLRVAGLDPLMKVRTLRVVASAEGYGLAWKALNPDAEQAEAELRLTAVQPVRGHIVGIQGEPAAGVQIHVAKVTRPSEQGEREGDETLRPPAGSSLCVTTDDKGDFRFAGFGPNVTLELEVLDPRYERKEEWRVNTADKKQCENIRLVLAPGRYIEGRAVYQDTGKPVPHAHLRISNPIIETDADADGRFKVPLYTPRDGDDLNLYSRDVLIAAWPPPGEPYLGDAKGVDFPKGVVRREVVLRFAPAALVRGKITEAGSGRPVAGARVAYSSGYDHSVVSGADGSFQIAAAPGLGRLHVTHPSGEYVAQALGSGGGTLDRPIGDPSYHHAVIDLEVTQDEKVKEVNVTLRRGVTIKGRLVGPDGKPVPSALMFVSAHRPRFENTMHPVHVRGGEFEARGCDPAKKYQLLFLEYPRMPRLLMMAEGLQTYGQLWLSELVNGKDRRGASVEVLAKEAVDKPLVVRLAPCGAVKLRFVDAAGKPKADFIPWLQLVVTPGPQLWKAIEDKTLAAEVVSLAGPYGDQPPGQPKTDAQGYVTYQGLIPGATYRVKTYGDNMGRNIVLKDFTVEAGKTAELEIVVK